MRIAFVGKGGSGKSTLSASFASFLTTQTDKPVLVFDADLNIHAPELLGFTSIPFDKHLSNPKTSEKIKRWLIGEDDINNLGAFRKSTPPTRKSNIIDIQNIKETPVGSYGLHNKNLSVFAVGTYQEEEIGAACYHTNLAILENILTHTNDKEGYLVADMVAGVDSFAGTLHAQFDLTCLVVEPTMRSIEVYTKYISLAKEAGIVEGVMVVGNKTRNEKDKDFIKNHIPPEKIIGFFADDEHIRDIDQDGKKIEVSKLNNESRELLKKVFEVLKLQKIDPNKRLKKIWELHKKYINQNFVKERYGNLETQIDIDFYFY